MDYMSDMFERLKSLSGMGMSSPTMGSLTHRRLSTTPAWTDILIILIICGLLFLMLRGLLHMSAKWQRYLVVLVLCLFMIYL